MLQEALDVSSEGPTAGQAPPLACGGGVVRRQGLHSWGEEWCRWLATGSEPNSFWAHAVNELDSQLAPTCRAYL